MWSQEFRNLETSAHLIWARLGLLVSGGGSGLETGCWGGPCVSPRPSCALSQPWTGLPPATPPSCPWTGSTAGRFLIWKVGITPALLAHLQRRLWIWKGLPAFKVLYRYHPCVFGKISGLSQALLKPMLLIQPFLRIQVLAEISKVPGTGMGGR